MKLPDVNIWIAMAVSGHPFHATSKAWLDRQDEADSIRSGSQLVSADKAFSQFKGLDFHLIAAT